MSIREKIRNVAGKVAYEISGRGFIERAGGEIDTAADGPGFWDGLPPAVDADTEDPDLGPTKEDIEQGFEPDDSIALDREEARLIDAADAAEIARQDLARAESDLRAMFAIHAEALERNAEIDEADREFTEELDEVFGNARLGPVYGGRLTERQQRQVNEIGFYCVHPEFEAGL